MGNLLFAQHHEFSINVGGGLSMLQYTPNTTNVILVDIPSTPYVAEPIPSSGGKRPGFGGNVGIGYHYFFTPQWGVGTGVNMALYNSQMKLKNYTVDNDEYSISGIPADFVFRYTFENYREKQRITMVTVPLMLQYQTKGYSAFYIALGGKVAIPMAASYNVKDSFATVGYFHETKTPYDSLYAQGFGRYYRSVKENLDMKVAYMVSAELGMKFYMEHLILYTGVYFDYGLSELRKEGQKAAPLIGYQPETPAEFTYGNMLASGGDKLYPISVGITMRLAWGTPASKVRGAISRGMVVPPVHPSTTLFKRRR